MKHDRWMYAFLFNNMAIGSLGTLVPLYIIYLGGGAYELGVFTTVINLASVPSTVFWAKVTDYLARRKVFVVFGLISTFLTSILYSFSRSFVEIYLISALQGFLVSSAGPATGMLLIETRPKKFWNPGIAKLQINNSLGMILGLVIGSLTRMFFAFSEVFILLSTFALISTLIALVYVEEPRITLERETIVIEAPRIRERIKLIWNAVLNPPTPIDLRLFLKEFRYSLTRDFPLFLMGCFTLFMGIAIFFTPLTALLKDMMLNDSTILLLNAIPQFVSITLYGKLGKIQGELAQLKLLLKAVSLRIGIFLLFPLAYLTARTTNLNLFTMEVILSVLFVFIGATWPIINISTNAILAKFAAERYRSSGYGYFNAVIGVASIVGAYVGGVVADFYGYLASTLVAVFFLGVCSMAFKKLEDSFI